MRWLFSEKECMHSVESECLAILRICLERPDDAIPERVERLIDAFVRCDVPQFAGDTSRYDHFREHGTLAIPDDEAAIAVMLAMTQDIIGATDDAKKPPND
jgi:hypothetical protein